MNLQTIASNLRPFLENLDAHIIEAIEENEEFEIKGFEKGSKSRCLIGMGKRYQKSNSKLIIKSF
ncbi:hypothetical protein JP0557_05950 [Helicobacter pylori]